MSLNGFELYLLGSDKFAIEISNNESMLGSEEHNNRQLMQHYFPHPLTKPQPSKLKGI